MITKKYPVSQIQQSFMVLLALMLLFSCAKQNAAPMVLVEDRIDTVAKLVLKGSFINGPYGNVTGEANIYNNNGKFILQLNNINVSNGPDLHVYLSKEVQPKSFIDLGKLKSTNGTQSYEINGTPNFETYKYALIHCQQYDHLFGSAELK